MNTSSKAGNLRQCLMLAAALSALAIAMPAHASLGNAPAQTNNNPSGLADLLRQARQAMSQGHPNVAIIYLKNAAALAPKNTGVRMELGVAYLKSGDPLSAGREFRTARQDGAPDAQVLPLLFDAMLARNESTQLLDQFPAPHAGDKSALAATTLRARALAQIQTGHDEQALDSINQALTINRDPQSLVVRARLARDQKDNQTALALTEEAYNKAPRDLNVALQRIATLQSANKPDQALAVADNLVKQQPGNPVSLLSRAAVLIQLKQDARANTDVDAVLARWKGLPQAQYYKGLLLERAKNPQGAWAAVQALPPEFVNARPETGMMVSEMAAAAGHTDVAITILSGTVSRFPDAVDPRILLAAQYVRLKNAQRALDILAPLKDSQEPRAMVLMGQAYALDKQYAKSTEYFDKASASGFGGELLKRQLAAGSIQRGDFDAAIKQLREMTAKQPTDAVNAGMLVAALVRSGDVPGAAVAADKFAAAAPKNAYGPLYQGQVAAAKADFKGSLADFSKAIALDPKFVLAYYDRAVARAASGDINGANADLDAVLRIDPKNVMAMVRSAEFAIRQGQDAKAQEILTRAVASDPKNSVPNLALASFYIGRNRTKEAGAAIGAYLKLVPNDPNAQMMQAEVQLASGQADPALATFKRLAAQKPDSPQLQLMLGSALVAKKDNNGALAAYRKAVQLAPKFALARASLIRFSLATNNTDTALGAAMDGVKQDPGSASDLLLASTLISLKKNTQAEDVLKKSIAQHPSETAAVMYSQILRQGAKTKQADAVLTSWIAAHPKDVGARLEMAQQQMQTNPNGSEQQFRAVLKVQPGNAIALNNLSWLLQKKDPKQAVVYAEQAAKQAPQSAPVLDTLGWVKWQAKDTAGALPVLQKAHATDPNNAEIAYHLAVVLDAVGRRAEAKKTLAAGLATNQNFSEKTEAEALNVRLR